MLEKLVISLIIIISYILQSGVDFLVLGRIHPDLLLLVTLYFGLTRGSFSGLWIGFFSGLLQDINLGGISEIGVEKINYYIGINALSKALIGYTAGKFAELYRKDNIVFILISVSLFSMVKGFMVLFLIKIFYQNISTVQIVTIILPESVYNALLGLILFRALDSFIGKDTSSSGKSSYINA